jgi:hypothetical protein
MTGAIRGFTFLVVLLPYYGSDVNAIDQAALVLQLRALGNTNAQLITTTGKGFRPPGTRNPHSWTIVDEPDPRGLDCQIS